MVQRTLARLLLAVHDLSLFHRFVRMCAARSGQLLNLAALGADCGISAVTAGKRLSVLETSYLVMRLRPYHRNLGKLASDWPQAARKWTGFADMPTLPPLIIYGGADRYARQGCEVMGGGNSR